MTELAGEKLMRWARHICGTSVDDALIGIKNEENLTVLDAALHYEIQHMRRKTMIKNLKSRIRKLVKTGSPRPRTVNREP